MTMELAEVCSYAIPGNDNDRIDRCVQADESYLWAVRRGGWAICMNRDGWFVYEPQPSSRGEEFRRQCRWPTAEAAYDAWKWLIHDAETHDESTIAGQNDNAE